MMGLQCIRALLYEEDKTGLKLLFPDVLGEFGLPGILLNCIILIFTSFTFSEKVLLYKQEKKKTFEFLTDMRHLVKGEYFDLKDHEVERLTWKLMKKIIFFRVYLIFTVITANGLITSGTLLFIYRNQQMLAVVLAVIQHIVLSILITSLGSHVFLMFLSYMLVTDCLKARIQSLYTRLSDIGDHNFSEVDRILDSLESLMSSLQKYHHTLRPLLRNLTYLCKCELCMYFVVISIEMPLFLRITSVMPIASGCFILISTSLYVSQVRSKFRLLYEKLNTVYTKMSSTAHRFLALKWKTRLALKELGNDGEDGHFVLGLAAGYGPEIMSLEVFNDIMETICDAMMFRDIINKRTVKK
jgi:hypothetical protein